MSLQNTDEKNIDTHSSSPAAPVPASAAAPRFEYIDGLRGVAATMVAIGHLAHAAADRQPDILGPFVSQLASMGRYGVQIFFVLSGFVIAHSVAGGAYSFKYFGRFVARRFVRLDLPLWSVIALEICLLWLSGQVMAGYARELPPISQILANAFYLQQFLGYEHIVPVFWTLCYEVQFYLVLVLSLVLFAKLQDMSVPSATIRLIKTIVIAASFLWSLAIFVGLLPKPHPALFLDRWFQFVLGVVTYLYYRGHCDVRWFVGALVLCVASAIAFDLRSYQTITLWLTAGTAVAIVASFHLQAWRALLVGPTMQFLGRISYSLYLLHSVVGWRAVVVVRELIGSNYSTWWAYFAFAVGVAVSITASWIMYLIIESPAMKLARTIALPKGTPDNRPGVFVQAPASPR